MEAYQEVPRNELFFRYSEVRLQYECNEKIWGFKQGISKKLEKLGKWDGGVRRRNEIGVMCSKRKKNEECGNAVTSKLNEDKTCTIVHFYCNVYKKKFLRRIRFQKLYWNNC